MYGGFDVYKVYLGVKLHFTSKTYDYIKYGGKVNASLDSFTKRKEAFNYHFRADCVSISNDLNARGISFDDSFRSDKGQHPRILRLLIQTRIGWQTAVVMEHFLSYIKDWNMEIKEKIVWPEIASTITRLKPFINFNATECKLIMKEIFVNEPK